MDTTILTPYFLDQIRPGDAYGLQSSADHEVVVDPLPDRPAQERMALIYQQLANLVSGALEQGQRPISLAGDCCATIGVMAGLQRAGLEPTLLWFDAHGDFNTWVTTPSGFLGGMPLAMAVGRGEQTLLNRTEMRPWSEEKVILTDARDLDPEERELVNASNIQHLTEVAELLKPGAFPEGPLYIHFDTDIIDPKETPAMNYPAPNGPSAADIERVFSALARTGHVVAVSVSLWEPRLDPDGQTRSVAMHALQSLLTV